MVRIQAARIIIVWSEFILISQNLNTMFKIGTIATPTFWCNIVICSMKNMV